MPNSNTIRVYKSTPRVNTFQVQSQTVKTVGERIRQARAALGWSGLDLALKAGYKSQSGISNLENRVGGTGGGKIAAVAKILNVPIEWLISGPDSDTVPFITELSLAQPHGATIYPVDRDNFPTQRPEANDSTVVTLPPPKPDRWTVRAIEILGQLNEAQRAACVVNLEIYLSAVGLPKYGQTL